MKKPTPGAALPFFQSGKPLAGELTAGRMNRLSSGLAERTPMPGTGLRLIKTASGFSYTTKKSTRGASLPLGFKVRLNAAKTAVTISPSVITGLTGVSAFPTIGGTRLDAETAPTLNVSSGDEIYATVELDPVATLRAGTGIGSGDSAVPAVYEIGSSYSAISTTFDIAIVSESLERLPVIDSTSGAVETSGLYLIPIAKIVPAGESIRVQQYCYGPIAVNYCTGNLTIIPPTIITSGNFVTVNA